MLMTTRKITLGRSLGLIFVVAFVVATLLGTAYLRGSHTRAGARQDATPTSSVGPLSTTIPAGPLVGPDGKTIMLTPPDPNYIPPTTGEAAIATATPHIATTEGPTSIEAALAVFGEGDPVWVVTFDGICTSVSNGPPSDQEQPACPITSETAIVNAKTGDLTSVYWGSPNSPSPK
jgi:hypothetical protein